MRRVPPSEWQACQEFERRSWGDGIYLSPENGEIQKQNHYAAWMGIVASEDFKAIDLEGKSVLDVGCGPVSLLLRSHNGKRKVGIDPLDYGEGVRQVYSAREVELLKMPAEEMRFADGTFDEVWMYNCLQHVYDPDMILQKIQKVGKRVRIFEWLDIPAHEGHPHELTEAWFVKHMGLSKEQYRITQFHTPILQGKAIVINKMNVLSVNKEE